MSKLALVKFAANHEINNSIMQTMENSKTVYLWGT